MNKYEVTVITGDHSRGVSVVTGTIVVSGECIVFYDDDHEITHVYPASRTIIEIAKGQS